MRIINADVALICMVSIIVLALVTFICMFAFRVQDDIKHSELIEEYNKLARKYNNLVLAVKNDEIDRIDIIKEIEK